MSDNRFRLLGVEEARRILRSEDKSAESYHLRVRAGRRLMPKTTELERMQARASSEEWKARNPAQWYRLHPDEVPPAGLDLSTPIAVSVEPGRARIETPASPDPARLEQLRAKANARPHKCAGYGCPTLVKGHELLCFEHWVLLPDWLQERLAIAYNPRAAMAWPIELVEQAIKYTMTDGDLAGVVARVETSLQGQLFEGVA